jgi:hypothetical protein
LEEILKQKSTLASKLAGLAVALAAISMNVSAQNTSWTSLASGNWEDATWSSGLPASTKNVFLTNAGIKAVQISPATRTNAPLSTTVSNFTVSGPIGQGNEFLLNFAGGSGALHVLSNFNVGFNGTVACDHSGFQVDGTMLVDGFVNQDGPGTNIIGQLLYLATNGTAFYNQTNGFVFAGNLSVGSLPTGADGSFWQMNGTNIIQSTLRIAGANSPFTSYEIDAGSLSAGNLVLSAFSEFDLFGGVVNATNIVLDGATALLRHTGGTLNNVGTFTFGGGAFISSQPENLGKLVLTNDSGDDMNGFTQQFAKSSALAWNGTGFLHITNWVGSTNGGGANQFIVGNSAAGLTVAQLSRILFENPSGFSTGSYPARILSTGEVVPTGQPILFIARSGANVIVSWLPNGNFVLQSASNLSGPYSDVVGAGNPYTNTPSIGGKKFYGLRKGP